MSQAAVLATVMPQSAPLDLPSPADVLYPDIDFSAPVPFPTEPDTTAADPSTTVFQVDTLQKADWVVAKILDAEARMARRSSFAADLHARVESWLNKANAADSDSTLYLSSLLRPFVESEVAIQRRSRTLLLPSGSASLRKLPDRLDIVDRDAALAFCETSHPEAVVVRKDLSKTALKSLIFSQGEAIIGITAELGGDELYIKSRD
jgi:hypothetical protein